MRYNIIIGLIFSVISTVGTAGTHWVTSDRAEVRTCPSSECGRIGKLYFREGIDILERKDGWARISKYYSAFCENGLSTIVDEGEASCSEENGIIDGELAEWVRMSQLSKEKPKDPGKDAEGIYKLISGSDDYRRFKSEFAEAAEELIDSGKCSEEDFIEMGGWIKSATTYKNKPVYFMYCGNMRIDNRIYLNVKTGKIFK